MLTASLTRCFPFFTSAPLLHYSTKQLPCPLVLVANQTSNCLFQGIEDDIPRQLVAHSELFLLLVEPVIALLKYPGSQGELRYPHAFRLPSFCTLSIETFTVSSPRQTQASYALDIHHSNNFAMNVLNMTIPPLSSNLLLFLP